MPLPDYLYHATPKANATSIAMNGLQPRSKGGQAEAYLCMSGSKQGAVTLGAQASDIIFRVHKSSLNEDAWQKTGAGKEEWRSNEGIPAASLEYRRNLGNSIQKTWRPANLYPTGMHGKA
jgi:hypothetical protein